MGFRATGARDKGTLVGRDFAMNFNGCQLTDGNGYYCWRAHAEISAPGKDGKEWVLFSLSTARENNPETSLLAAVFRLLDSGNGTSLKLPIERRLDIYDEPIRLLFEMVRTAEDPNHINPQSPLHIRLEGKRAQGEATAIQVLHGADGS